MELDIDVLIWRHRCRCGWPSPLTGAIQQPWSARLKHHFAQRHCRRSPPPPRPAPPGGDRTGDPFGELAVARAMPLLPPVISCRWWAALSLPRLSAVAAIRSHDTAGKEASAARPGRRQGLPPLRPAIATQHFARLLLRRIETVLRVHRGVDGTGADTIDGDNLGCQVMGGALLWPSTAALLAA